MTVPDHIATHRGHPTSAHLLLLLLLQLEATPLLGEAALLLCRSLLHQPIVGRLRLSKGRQLPSLLAAILLQACAQPTAGLLLRLSVLLRQCLLLRLGLLLLSCERALTKVPDAAQAASSVTGLSEAAERLTVAAIDAPFATRWIEEG